jgi:GTP-binding protein
MRFVDEAIIKVEAGNGGRGCLSFRREKFIPFGGPDGGDGGDGGSIFFEGAERLTTLIDFRYKRAYKAENGRPGMGALCSGKKGEDLVIFVPLGTIIYDNESQEKIGDIQFDGQRVLVAQGGFHGLGNARYKSSTNRAPRQITIGSSGEVRHIRLELKLLADVGLVGLPNAGKSTLIRAVSSSKSKIGDYPFTTLHPSLGVVRIGVDQSFVMADIPGLIEGASEGAGLGIRFLKHISRNALLLHMIDMYPSEEGDILHDAKVILQELASYDPELLEKPRFLVFNKVDMVPDEAQQKEIVDRVVQGLDWKGPVFLISARANIGVSELSYAIMQHLETVREDKNNCT